MMAESDEARNKATSWGLLVTKHQNLPDRCDEHKQFPATTRKSRNAFWLGVTTFRVTATNEVRIRRTFFAASGHLQGARFMMAI